MSWWSRIANLARGDRLSREIDEELESHVEEAIRQGRDPAEARRALGSPLRLREIGIRRAVGAQSGDIARRVTAEVFSMVLVGAVAGLALGMASVRHIESLLCQVKATDLGMLALPSLAIVVAALVAALPGVIRAVRIDPVERDKN